VIPSDNSCLFNAVGYVMEHNRNKASELRQVIAAAVASDPVKFNEVFLGKPNEAYCAWILDPENSSPRPLPPSSARCPPSLRRFGARRIWTLRGAATSAPPLHEESCAGSCRTSGPGWAKWKVWSWGGWSLRTTAASSMPWVTWWNITGIRLLSSDRL